MVYVVAADRDIQAVVLSDGEVLPFTALLDAEGEETLDIRLAVAATAELPNGAYLSLMLDDFPPLIRH